MEDLKQQIRAVEEQLAELRIELEKEEIKEKHKMRLVQGLGPSIRLVPDDELGKICKEMRMIDFLTDISGVYNLRPEFGPKTAVHTLGELAWILRPGADKMMAESSLE